ARSMSCGVLVSLQPSDRWRRASAPRSMLIHVPLHIRLERIADGVRHGRPRRRDMVLESALADHPKQRLKLRNLDDPVAAERLEHIVGEAPLADVRRNRALEIVGRYAAVAERAGRHAADDRAEGVLFADGAGDDLLIVHPLLDEEALRKVRA